MASRIWLTWEVQRRNRTLSKKLDATLYELISKKKGLARYAELIVKSYQVLINEKPRLLFVQNPSLVLALWAVLNRPFFSYRLIVDAHNAGLYPAEGRSVLLNFIASFVIRFADITLVTNAPLALVVINKKGRPFVLPDPLPDLLPDPAHKHRAKTKAALTYVCTWANDEPTPELIEAARELGDVLTLYITGRPPSWVKTLNLPANIVLTGFLSEADYLDLLQSSDALIVLTTRDNCLNCGAYEGVALEKPMILSDTEVIRAYFNTGVVYSQAHRQAIVCAIQTLLADLAGKQQQVSTLKVNLGAAWVLKHQDLEATLAALSQ